MGSQPCERPNVLPELQENLEELYPDLSLEEALQHQVSLYQSLKVTGVAHSTRSSDNRPSSSLVHSWRNSSSFFGSANYDLALDEAMARSLQEFDLEDEVCGHVAISESLRTTSRHTERANGGTSITQPNTYQDDLDPDQMTYEELQLLGEAIGSETKGLSKAEINSLPCYKLKSRGFFSKKINFEECVICYTAYKNRDSVIALPCAHKYHQTCIERWLVTKKTCPICQKEVKLN